LVIGARALATAMQSKSRAPARTGIATLDGIGEVIRLPSHSWLPPIVQSDRFPLFLSF
jgi:hypothetical protein